MAKEKYEVTVGAPSLKPKKKKTQQQKLQKNPKNPTQTHKQKKQHQKRILPQNKQRHSTRIRRNQNGKPKFNGTLDGKIVNMVPSGNRLEYVVVYEDSTEIIMLNSGVGKEVPVPSTEEK